MYTPAGNWSSYPPHKRDEDRPGESVLEETYYFEFAAGRPTAHGNVAGLGEALLAAELATPELLPYYQGRNEQAMVHAAVGFARMRSRLSTLACTSSVGPGATNMVTGAALRFRGRAGPERPLVRVDQTFCRPVRRRHAETAAARLLAKPARSSMSTATPSAE